MLTWISTKTLLVLGIILAVLPVVPMPHLVEKLIMLKNGTLTRPIDIFDLVMHGAPWVLLALKILREWAKRKVEVAR